MTWSTGSTLEHPARVALGVIEQGISALGGSNLWSLSERELLGLRIDQEATLARLHAQILAITREVDGPGRGRGHGCVLDGGLAARSPRRSEARGASRGPRRGWHHPGSTPTRPHEPSGAPPAHLLL
jgi:hypothetical protein